MSSSLGEYVVDNNFYEEVVDLVTNFLKEKSEV